ncbi:MAG TPA: gamma-glutamyl-gamma-aminobutyrate hydrolase family protein [Acidimicrobiales bacterium]|nr:gamma-glutamyl-gamma-aminobutyrate hydrolase family protein [Acidimicrobiales bacterium]
MIIFVDYEHDLARSAPWGERSMAARTRITYRLEDLSGQHCMLVRYDRISDDLLDVLGATAMCISGNGTPPDRYDAEALRPLSDIISRRRLPVFGFCGGFQLLAEVLGADLVALGPTDEPPPLESPYPAGIKHEYGYAPVDVVADHPLTAGLGTNPVFRHAHMLHVPEPPDGFDVLASTEITPIQMAVDDTHKIVGTQFHPEYWTDEHPDGRQLIENFFAWIS